MCRTNVCLQSEVYDNISLYFLITQILKNCAFDVQYFHLLTAACAFTHFRMYNFVFFLAVTGYNNTDAYSVHFVRCLTFTGYINMFTENRGYSHMFEKISKSKLHKGMLFPV